MPLNGSGCPAKGHGSDPYFQNGISENAEVSDRAIAVVEVKRHRTNIEGQKLFFSRYSISYFVLASDRRAGYSITE
jgi:hypothetical protein